MKNQPKFSKNIQLVISIVVIFIVFPNTIIAQQSYQDIVNRIDEIDYEMNLLTRKKEPIEFEFKKISDFSIKARPYISKANQLWEKVLQAMKTVDYYQTSPYLPQDKEYVTFKINESIRLKDSLGHLWSENDAEFVQNGGMLSFFNVQCNTIEHLQLEYQRTADYYLEQKTKYDDISKQLGKLNAEKHDLETKLKYMGEQGVGAMDPTGCWTLAFGNHISVITIKKQASGKYVGTLTVNELEDYEDGQVVLILERVSDNTFIGIEYTWEEKPNGMLGEAKIPAMITINTDNRFLTWTSDQTVTMSRCQ